MKERIKELFLTNRSAKQTITKNVFWLSASQFAGRLIRSIVIIYAARVLGAAEYGVFSYALGLAGFFTIFADIGISVLLTKEVAQQPEKSSRYFSTSFWIKNALLAIAALAIIFAGPHFSKIEAANFLLPLVALLVIFDNLREFCNAFFRAKEKMELEAITSLFMNIAITALGFAALYVSKTVGALTFSYVGSAGAGFLAAIFILREEFFKVIKNFDRKLIRPILSAAWPIALAGLLGAFMMNVDIIIIAWFKSAADIGFYSAGQKIVQFLYVLPAIVSSAMFPTISKAIKNNEPQKTVAIVERSISSVSLASFPIVIGGIILGTPFIRLLYGSAYLNSVATFQILLLGAIVFFPGAIFANLIFAYGQQKKLSVYSGAASLLNVILDIILIPIFGIAGSAAGTVIVQIAYYGLMWRNIKKINHFKILPHLKKIAAASVLMGTAAFFMNKLSINVIANIAVSASIYFIALFIMKEYAIEELKKMFNPARPNNKTI